MEFNKQNELTSKIETDQQADSYSGEIEQKKRGKTLGHRKKRFIHFLNRFLEMKLLGQWIQKCLRIGFLKSCLGCQRINDMSLLKAMGMCYPETLGGELP